MTTGQTTTPGKLKPHLALIFANVLFGMNFSFYVSIIHHYMDFEVIGVILAFIGAAVLILGNGIPVLRSREFGNLFMFISVLAAATNTIFIKPSLMRYGTILVTGWYYIIGLVISAPFFAKGLMHYDFASLPVAGGLEIAYILVLGTVLPNYLLYYETDLGAYGPLLLFAADFGHYPGPVAPTGRTRLQ